MVTLGFQLFHGCVSKQQLQLHHAQQAGELITALGEHPSLGMGALLETHNHDIGAILKESLEFEQDGLALYRAIVRSCARQIDHS